LELLRRKTGDFLPLKLAENRRVIFAAIIAIDEVQQVRGGFHCLEETLKPLSAEFCAQYSSAPMRWSSGAMRRTQYWALPLGRDFPFVSDDTQFG
jgi:hypothetical protein